MGLCVSTATPVHVVDYDYGVDDIVVYENHNIANKSLKVGSIFSHQGMKGLNQDTAILYQGYGIEDGVFCGVFDGHGKNGHVVSKVVRNRLPSFLMNHRLNLGKKWKEAFKSSFCAMDREIKLLEKFDFSCSGTAAVVVVKQGHDLLIANLGDSRAILGTKTDDGVKAVQLTTDQKPSVPCEAERIRNCNGRVLSLQAEPHIKRVWLPNEDRPGLAMSRAFGDFVLKNHGLIAHPDVSHHHISHDDQFVVLATDGVWDVLSNDEVVSVVCSTKSKEEAAKAVVDASIAAWKENFPESKRDDCTVICLFLQKG